MYAKIGNFSGASWLSAQKNTAVSSRPLHDYLLHNLLHDLLHDLLHNLLHDLLHYERRGKELFACFILDGEQVLSLTEGANVYRFVG